MSVMVSDGLQHRRPTVLARVDSQLLKASTACPYPPRREGTMGRIEHTLCVCVPYREATARFIRHSVTLRHADEAHLPTPTIVRRSVYLL